MRKKSNVYLPFNLQIQGKLLCQISGGEVTRWDKVGSQPEQGGTAPRVLGTPFGWSLQPGAHALARCPQSDAGSAERVRQQQKGRSPAQRHTSHARLHQHWMQNEEKALRGFYSVSVQLR